jgi:hypothetical protein
MSAAPKYRWFRFSLRTMFVVATALAAIVWGAAVALQRWNEEFIFVGYIPDAAIADQFERELHAHGIEGGCEGSVGYGVKVSRRHAVRTKELLRDFGRRNPSKVVRVRE